MKKEAFRYSTRVPGCLSRDNGTISKRVSGMSNFYISDLKFSEQIIVWTARRFGFIGNTGLLSDLSSPAQREEAIRKVGMELGGVFLKLPDGTVGNKVASDLESVISSFTDSGYRGLKLNFQSCRQLSDDERLLLSFFAGCQRGDHAHVTELLIWFFPCCKTRDVIQKAGAVADVFKSNHLYLPQRLNLSRQNYQLAANKKTIH